MSLSYSKKYRLILSAVHMVYRLVNSTYTVKELSLRLTRLLCQFIRASCARVYILDENKKAFVFVASFDNQINVLLEKPSELRHVPAEAMDVAAGASIFNEKTIGLPLIAEDYLGAIFVTRSDGQEAFNDFDREMLSVFAEQTVTAIRNLQFQQQHERIILGSIKSMGSFMQKQGRLGLTHNPVYVQVVHILAQQLHVNHDEIKNLEYAAMLHDIGVIDVPYEILSKRERLSPEEFKLIRNHTAHSVELIRPVEFLKPVLPIILHHHEHYDGSGYPSGLKKEQIPLGARIIALVDAFEAMLQGRPYRKAMSLEASLDEISRKSGSQFDPKIVDLFCKLAVQKKFRNILSLLKR